MLRHKYTVPVCLGIVAVTLLVTVLFVFSGSFGVAVMQTEMPYAESLFSTDRVHTLDLVVDEAEWQNMLDNASDKEYIPVDVVIDGNAVKNVAIRTKGNSSLTSIVSSDSDRYSFKIEFDHYQTGQTYYGLDKLALNNIAQDNTYLKDYVSYQMMNSFDADAPLSSFIYITVNGEDWGLYLAVEGIEEAFASRNYGSDYGLIYKPDSMDMAGGGNRDEGENRGQPAAMPEMTQDGQMPENMAPPGNVAENAANAEAGAQSGEQAGGQRGGGMGGGMPGGSSTDVALVYTDDEYDSYPNIFDNPVFDITNADKDRLIATLKQLSEGENLEEIINIEEVLRYFVVHNFVLNFDSYTGSMMHNYYLYEEDGMLSMIAWDYNLAFGAFGGGRGGGTRSGESESGGSSDSTTTMVNFPIDTPVSGTTLEERPLLGQLLSNETYLALYHELFDEFITSFVDSGEFERMIDNAIALISPCVEKDPTAFCTYEEFTEASAILKEFCLLRAESVRGQLDGSIPSTSEGQAADGSAFVDASHIDIQSMGSNAASFGGARGERSNRQANMTAGEFPDMNAEATGETGAETAPGAGMGNRPDDGFSRPGDQIAAVDYTGQYLYLAVSALLLILGVFLAKKYRVHR